MRGRVPDGPGPRGLANTAAPVYTELAADTNTRSQERAGGAVLSRFPHVRPALSPICGSCEGAR